MITLAKIWNESLSRQDRKLEKRERIWASELGGAYIDRYLKMNAETPTNPPNDRSLRKFAAGSIWEWIVSLVYVRTGIMKEEQRRAEFTIEGMLPVTGKIDFILGGSPDYDKALKEIESLRLPEVLYLASIAIIEHFRINFKQSPEMINEVKSASSFMFEKVLKKGAEPHHLLQLYHYHKSTDIKDCLLTYVCREDCRIHEIYLTDQIKSDLENKYFEDVRNMTEYFNKKETPPKEELILFDGKFNKNYKVEYSNYLTKLYGFNTPEEYRGAVDKKVASYNRTLKRVLNGDKMTKLNLETIGQAKSEFDWDECVRISKESNEPIEDGDIPD